MSLETTLQTIELNRFRAAFTAKEQNVAKLLSGATREDIRILESKLSGTERALVEAKKNLMDKLQDAFTKSDDAVRVKVDQFISNPRGINPQLAFTPPSAALGREVERLRVDMESLLVFWDASISRLEVASDMNAYSREVKDALSKGQSYL